MGAAFSEPVTAKETEKVESDKYFCGSSSMQGWRPTMEDAHIHILSCERDPELSIFAVFDGHGGDEVSIHVSVNIVEMFFNQPTIGNIPKALRATFVEMDNHTREAIQSNTVGSTGNMVVIKNKKMYCANIGDTRVVVSVAGLARDLSEDHKPHSDKELQRIINAGGYVTNYRVNGSLALSRAFGDFQYKETANVPPDQQMVIAVPDITVVDITPEFEFFVIACDGIWDVMTSQEVVNFVRLRVANSMMPDVICEELMTNCLAPDARMGGLGCDNMTTIVSCFIEGRNYKQLAQSCSAPVMYNYLPPLPMPPLVNIKEINLK